MKITSTNYLEEGSLFTVKDYMFATYAKVWHHNSQLVVLDISWGHKNGSPLCFCCKNFRKTRTFKLTKTESNLDVQNSIKCIIRVVKTSLSLSLIINEQFGLFFSILIIQSVMVYGGWCFTKYSLSV